MEQVSYFITGANGFIGSALARELVRRGEEVTLLIHRADDHPFLGDLPSPRVRGDIMEPETFSGSLDRETCVIHCAGLVSFSGGEDESIIRTNCEGTRRLLDACLDKKIRSAVFLSAGAVWGSTGFPDKLISEDSPRDLNTKSVYGLSKIRAEEICQDAVKTGLDVRIVNPATAYGPGDLRLRAGGKVVKEVCDRGINLIPPGGTSWININDLVAGIVAVAEQGRAGENYILSSGNLLYRELLMLIAETCGMKARGRVLSPRLRMPLTAAAGIAEKGFRLLGRPGPVSPFQIEESFRYKYFDASKARDQLGFSPKNSLEYSISQTLEFNRYYNL